MALTAQDAEALSKGTDPQFLPSHPNFQGHGGGSSSQVPNLPSAVEFAQQQEVPIAKALEGFTTAQQAQEKPLEIHGRLEEEAQLPQQRKTAATLREEIGNIEDTLKSVEGVVAGTSRESFITQSQRERLITEQKEPLQENLADLSRSLGRIQEGISAASQNIGVKTSLALQGQEMALEPFRLSMEIMSSRAARLSSAFSVDSQNQLQLSLEKIRRQQQLDDVERDRAFTLLQQESAYTRELQKMAANVGADVGEGASPDDILRAISDSATEDYRQNLLLQAANSGVPVNGTEDVDTLLNLIGQRKAPKPEPGPVDTSQYYFGENNSNVTWGTGLDNNYGFIPD